MLYAKPPASGHFNIRATKHNSFSVLVNGDYLGTFYDIEKALDVRDKDREKKGMPKLNDRSINAATAAY